MNVKKVAASTNGVLSGVYKIVALKLSAGSDAATAIVYDNASAQSGDEVAKLTAVANSNDNLVLPVEAGPMISNGISVTLSGTGPVLYIYYV